MNRTSQRAKSIATFLLLALGLGMWWCVRDVATNTAMPLAVAVIAGSACLLPGAWSRVARILDRYRHPSSRQLPVAAGIVALISWLVLYTAAVLRHRDFFPLMHDEFAYLLQARTLAGGHLWLPSHPLADFFETFFVFVRPVYSSIYFPGTAMLNVSGIWLGLPEWFIPLLIAAAIAALLYLIVTEMSDGVAGLLAVVLLLGLSTFRGLSIMVMSHSAMTLLGLALMFAWLRWRTRRSPLWAVIIGALAGWAAITRPADAVAFALAVGAGMLLDLRDSPRRRDWIVTPLLIIVAAAPFLLLQLAFDRGVTGRWLYSPYQMYLEREQPGTQFSLTRRYLEPHAVPVSSLPEKQAYYADFLTPEVHRYQQDGPLRVWFDYRANWLATGLACHPALLALAPVGLLGLLDRRRCVLAATALLLLLLYSFNPVFLEWYTLPWTGAVLLLIVLGIERLTALSPPQMREAIGASLTVGVATLAVVQLLLPPTPGGEGLRSPVLEALHRYELQPHSSREVLLFNLNGEVNAHTDPVFNITTAWPDDATIIRARDLGLARDRELLEYYAQHQPDRRIVTLDMRTGATTEWGPAIEALKRWPATEPSGPSTER
jgi:4-amino-4-deoxy-L-arabinose transferase-like glycosyltransferase